MKENLFKNYFLHPFFIRNFLALSYNDVEFASILNVKFIQDSLRKNARATYRAREK